MATLFPGQSLLPGQSLQSDNGLYALTMQSDGNVVLRNSASAPLWRTGTGGGQFVPADFIMQTDGNLVLYDTSGQYRWASKTQGNPGAFLNVQDDGNVVVYRAGSTSQTANNSLWSSGTNVRTPLTLKTVVDNRAMLNVGDANLDYLSNYMLSNPNLTEAAGGGVASYTEQGIDASQPGLWCGGNTVTVNANIDASFVGGSNSVGSWTWQDLQAAFASAVRAAMQTASKPTHYQNYSYTEVPVVDPFGSGGVTCVDPQPSDSGYYIPAAIRIKAWNIAPDNTAEQGYVTLTYSTGDNQSGGSPCDTIDGVVGGLLPLVLDDAVAAVVGTTMTVICDLIDG